MYSTFFFILTLKNEYLLYNVVVVSVVLADVSPGLVEILDENRIEILFCVKFF